MLGLLYGGFSLKGIVAAAVAATALFLPRICSSTTPASWRQEELRKGLAEALDMLTVCVEAGQGFDGGLMQVARTVTGPISGEFARVLSEIQIGKTRGEAFADGRSQLRPPRSRTSSAPSSRLTASACRSASSCASRPRRCASCADNAPRSRRSSHRQGDLPGHALRFPVIFIVLLGPAAIKIVRAFTGSGEYAAPLAVVTWWCRRQW